MTLVPLQWRHFAPFLARLRAQREAHLREYAPERYTLALEMLDGDRVGHCRSSSAFERIDGVPCIDLDGEGGNFLAELGCIRGYAVAWIDGQGFPIVSATELPHAPSMEVT